MTEKTDRPKLNPGAMQVKFEADKPMQLIPLAPEDPSPVTSEVSQTCRKIGEIFVAYLKARKNLLLTKYAHLKSLVPEYWTSGAEILIASCPGGLVVRYEGNAATSMTHAVGAWMDIDLPSAARLFSQNLVICRFENDGGTLPTDGMVLSLTAVSAGSDPKNIAEGKITIETKIDEVHPPWHAGRPYRPLSVRNQFELGIVGEIVENSRPFVVRTTVRLPVGWDCIEIFPRFDHEGWKSEYADIWAEAEIMAAVIARQSHEAHCQGLDPYAAARTQYASLLREFKTLLDSDPPEETLQKFLRANPSLLCPLNTKMWPKLPLGNHVTDFVFRDARASYLLVELERAGLPLFREDGHSSAPLTHARGQIHDWQRYIEDNLGTVQRELGLTGITANPDALVVIGRTQTLTAENRRKLALMRNSERSIRIATYDDIYDDAKAIVENFLGPIFEVGPHTSVYFPSRPTQ